MNAPSQLESRFDIYWHAKKRLWFADYKLPSGEMFGVRMPLYRLLQLLRGA